MKIRLSLLFVALLAVFGIGCKREVVSKGTGKGTSKPMPKSAEGATGPTRRVALVIGNSRYKALQKLDACKNDAETMAATFKRIGIELHEGKALFDLSTDQMDKAIAGFARSLDRSTEAFLYFTGHGAQIGGSNYILPVNYDAEYEAQAKRQAISLDTILNTLEKTDSRLRVVILDACRNPGNLLPGEPVAKDATMAKGLAKLEVDTPETLVCFATKHGTLSFADTQASFYSRVLAEEILKPGRVDEVLRIVGRRVAIETAGKQQPFTYGNLFQDHYFVQPVTLLSRPGGVLAELSPASLEQSRGIVTPATPAPATVGPVAPASDASNSIATLKRPTVSPKVKRDEQQRYINEAISLLNALPLKDRSRQLNYLVGLQLQFGDDGWKETLRKAKSTIELLGDDSKSMSGWLALSLAEAGNITDAMTIAKNISDEYYRDDALRWIAGEQAKAGDAFGAKQTIENNIRNKDHKSEALAHIATAQLRKGQLDEALKATKTIKGSSREFLAVAVVKALVAKNRLKESMDLSETISYKPYAFEAKLSIGVAKHRNGDSAYFQRILSEAERHARGNKDALIWSVIATAKAMTGDLEGAEEAFRNCESSGDSTWSDSTADSLVEIEFGEGRTDSAAYLAKRLRRGFFRLMQEEANSGMFERAKKTAEFVEPTFRGDAVGIIAGCQSRFGFIEDAAKTLDSINNDRARCVAYIEALKSWFRHDAE